MPLKGFGQILGLRLCPGRKTCELYFLVADGLGGAYCV